MQYDWIDFYTEFATKLLPFKTDRKTLIQKMYAVYDTVECAKDGERININNLITTFKFRNTNSNSVIHRIHLSTWIPETAGL